MQAEWDKQVAPARMRLDVFSADWGKMSRSDVLPKWYTGTTPSEPCREVGTCPQCIGDLLPKWYTGTTPSKTCREAGTCIGRIGCLVQLPAGDQVYALSAMMARAGMYRGVGAPVT